MRDNEVQRARFLGDRLGRRLKYLLMDRGGLVVVSCFVSVDSGILYYSLLLFLLLLSLYGQAFPLSQQVRIQG